MQDTRNTRHWFSRVAESAVCGRFRGLATAPEALQAVIDVTVGHSRKWRYLANVNKIGVLKFAASPDQPDEEVLAFR